MLERNFHLKPSKIYLNLIIVILIASVLIVLFVTIANWLKVLLSLFLLFYGGHIIWRFGLLKSQNSILQIQQQETNQWLLYTRDKKYLADLRGDSTVTSKIAILRFQVSKHFFPQSCVIFRDSLVQGQYRELVIRCLEER